MTRPAINGNTRVYAVLGHPVEHSLSPDMHNAAFQELGLNAVYVALPSPPEQIEAALHGLRALNLAGVNVTVPHKSAVLPFLDEITPIAQKIGAVNTIRNRKGHLVGTNTDASGFLRSLEPLNFAPANQTIALLGAGGSARGLMVGLADAGAAALTIWNRTPERAQALVAELAPLFPQTRLQAVSQEELYAGRYDLVINTTTVGMSIPGAPVDLAAFQEVRHVADIIYRPAHTPLLQQAEQLRIPAINGLGMLLHQGCEAFTFWTGQPAPVGVMRNALLAGLTP